MNIRFLLKIALIVLVLVFVGILISGIVRDQVFQQSLQKSLHQSTAGLILLDKGGKVGVCHYTGSSKHPYEYKELSPDAAEAHKTHHNDKIGVKSAAECPKEKNDPTSAPIEPTDAEEETSVPTKADPTPDVKSTSTHDKPPSTSPPGTPILATVLPPATVPPTTINPTNTSSSDPAKTPGSAPTISTIQTASTPAMQASPTFPDGVFPTKLITQIIPSIPATKEPHRNPTKVVSQPTAAPTEDQPLDLQAKLDEAQAQLVKAEDERIRLDNQLHEAEEKLVKAENELEKANGNNLQLKKEIEDLRVLLNSLRTDKAVNAQEIKDLQNTIQILREFINATEAAEEQALWTKRGAIGAVIVGMLAIVFSAIFSTWSKDIRSSFRNRKEQPNRVPRSTSVQNLRSISVRQPVLRGHTTYLDVEVKPGVICLPVITYSSGKERLLDAKQARKNGKLSWRLKIDHKCNPGTWKVRIDCFPDGEFQELEFEVI